MMLSQDILLNYQGENEQDERRPLLFLDWPLEAFASLKFRGPQSSGVHPLT